jgi:uncharacterized protein with HEPN domain
MSSKYRNDKLYIDDILESTNAIEIYLKDKNYDDFIENRMLYAATIRELEIIGEAIGKISQVIKEKYTFIDYRTIKDFRNVLAHEYFGVDMEIVWIIATEKIPVLKQDILKMEV